MKKLVMLLIMGMLVFTAGSALACHIEFDAPALKQAAVGDVVTIEAIVIKEHRNCQLKDSDVSVELSPNLKIVSQTGWKTVGRTEIHNTLQIQVTGAGDASLRVFRECSKKGISEGIFTFQAI